ncbi:protein of unknown function DUF2204 [Pyrolobus fumarii 1A]|uniref:Nucleotidyltransferase n=1 Tax=Pyrolobus fumarii (strain DSM 11204 / 1A) TaxID=694429 RepID=G0EE22_PYRF1|nr:nucleotidyltransferase [Pyrolobus fumarii]AEM37938.1 protein of unknown function DUF2204 [Pyrolobus fumarii 1A]
MPYTLEDLARIMRVLSDAGVKATIIGSTVVQLEMRSKELEEDVDLFVEEPSPFIEEDFYRELARKNGWGFGQTWLGTPALIVRTGDKEIIVELYENIYDFYVPPEVLQRAPRKNIRGVEVKVLRVEDYALLKAKAGRDEDMSDLEELATLVKSGEVSFDRRLVRESIQYFPEEDQKLMEKRLKKVGLIE